MPNFEDSFPIMEDVFDDIIDKVRSGEQLTPEEQDALDKFSSGAMSKEEFVKAGDVRKNKIEDTITPDMSQPAPGQSDMPPSVNLTNYAEMWDHMHPEQLKVFTEVYELDPRVGDLQWDSLDDELKNNFIQFISNPGE